VRRILSNPGSLQTHPPNSSLVKPRVRPAPLHSNEASITDALRSFRVTELRELILLLVSIDFICYLVSLDV
jgi:hypothetical protein